MKLIAVVLAGVLGVPALAAAQTTKTVVARDIPPKPQTAWYGSPLVLDLSVRLYGANQQLGSHAGDADTEQVESYVWANDAFCSLSSSNTAPTGSPWVAWHFKAKVESKTARALVVKVDWQRLFEKGSKPASPVAGSLLVTIREGERTELDRVAVEGAGTCGVAEGRLELSVDAPHPFLLGYFTYGALSGYFQAQQGQQGQQGQRGQQGQQGAQGQRGQQGQQGAQGQQGQQGQRGQQGAQGQYGLAPQQYQDEFSRAFFPGVLNYTAELWLVHRKPDGSETVQQQTVKASGTGPAFSFPPIQVSTSRGVITLDFSGKLETTTDGRGKAFFFFNNAADPNAKQDPVVTPIPRIMLSISRRARAPGAPLLDITGGSTIALGIPAPNDVLSFEFPALQKETEDLLKGHQFSLRVRITSAGAGK